ncbi:hypothetical protein D3C84_879410 [compost metagenome]
MDHLKVNILVIHCFKPNLLTSVHQVEQKVFPCFTEWGGDGVAFAHPIRFICSAVFLNKDVEAKPLDEVVRSHAAFERHKVKLLKEVVFVHHLVRYQLLTDGCTLRFKSTNFTFQFV